MKFHFDKLVDAKGLKCPQPLLLAKLGIEKLITNQILLLETTDPHTDLDLQVWCERFGHKIIHVDENKNCLLFWIKKA